MTTQPCDDDGFAVDGNPATDEPTDPDPANADYDTPPPDDFEEWDETPPYDNGGHFPGGVTATATDHERVIRPGEDY